MLTFAREAMLETAEALTSELMEDGFVRAIVHGQTIHFAGQATTLVSALQASLAEGDAQLHVIVDRLTGGTASERVRDSLETALAKGDGQCYALVNQPLEGAKEAAIKALDLPAMTKIYGKEPIFIFDPNDTSNRPVPGIHDNALAFWRIYPQFLRDIFIRAFTDGISDPKNGRSRWTS